MQYYTVGRILHSAEYFHGINHIYYKNCQSNFTQICLIFKIHGNFESPMGRKRVLLYTRNSLGN